MADPYLPQEAYKDLERLFTCRQSVRQETAGIAEKAIYVVYLSCFVHCKTTCLSVLFCNMSEYYTLTQVVQTAGV